MEKEVLVKLIISTTGLSFNLIPLDSATIREALKIAPLNSTALTVAEEIPSMTLPSIHNKFTFVGTLISKFLYCWVNLGKMSSPYGVYIPIIGSL